MTVLDCLHRSSSYWERRRIVYNVVLAILTLYCWGPEILASEPRSLLGLAIVLGVFALIANVLFCLAYPVDVVLQLFSLDGMLKTTRPVLFASGLAIASGLALWVLLGTGMA